MNLVNLHIFIFITIFIVFMTIKLNIIQLSSTLSIWIFFFFSLTIQKTQWGLTDKCILTLEKFLYYNIQGNLHQFNKPAILLPRSCPIIIRPKRRQKYSKKLPHSLLKWYLTCKGYLYPHIQLTSNTFASYTNYC